MRIIAFLTDYSVVDRIIDHLKLTFAAAKPPPSLTVFQETLMAADPPVDEFPLITIPKVYRRPGGAVNSHEEPRRAALESISGQETPLHRLKDDRFSLPMKIR